MTMCMCGGVTPLILKLGQIREISASTPGRFTLGEVIPFSYFYWIRRWMWPREGSECWAEIFLHVQGIKRCPPPKLVTKLTELSPFTVSYCVILHRGSEVRDKSQSVVVYGQSGYATSADHLFLLWDISIQSMPPLSHVLKINLNIILPSSRMSSKWSLSHRYPHQNPIYTSPLSNTFHVPCPSHSSWFDHPKGKSSSYICHGVGPLVDPFWSHLFRSLFKDHEAFYLHVVSSFSCIPVICPKLVLFSIPL